MDEAYREKLRLTRVRLKCGEYDGVDVMTAWIAIDGFIKKSEEADACHQQLAALKGAIDDVLDGTPLDEHNRDDDGMGRAHNNYANTKKWVARLEGARTLPRVGVCKWWQVQDLDDSCWRTQCGEDYYAIVDGTPAENGLRFCHSCGRKIEAGEAEDWQ